MRNYILLLILIAAFIGTVAWGINYVNDVQTLSIYTIIIFTIGILVGTIRTSIIQGKRFQALKREEEKNAINSTESQAKVKVLEAKIQTLEKALENALKK